MVSDLDIVAMESRANGSSFAAIQKSSYNVVIKIEVMYTCDVHLFVRMTLPRRRLVNAFERIISPRHFFLDVRFFSLNARPTFTLPFFSPEE